MIIVPFVPFCGSLLFVAIPAVGLLDAEFLEAVLEGAEGEAQ